MSENCRSSPTLWCGSGFHPLWSPLVSWRESALLRSRSSPSWWGGGLVFWGVRRSVLRGTAVACRNVGTCFQICCFSPLGNEVGCVVVRVELGLVCGAACGRGLLVCSWGTIPHANARFGGQLRVDESNWWGAPCGGWDSHCRVGAWAYVARTDTHQVGAAVTAHKDHCFRWDSRLMDGRHARPQPPTPTMTLVGGPGRVNLPRVAPHGVCFRRTGAGCQWSVLQGVGYWGWLQCVGVGDSSGGQVGSGMGWWCLLGFSPVVFFRCVRRSQPQ